MEVELSTTIAGVRRHRLAPNEDDRGGLVELHRQGWLPEFRAVQWNLLTSAAGVLRGLHVHPRQSDLLVVVDGRMRLGLKDLRRGSATRMGEEVLELDGADPVAVLIPNGVAHGFHHHTAGRLVFATDAYYDPGEELGCRWDDPGVDLFRDLPAPRLSPRDAAAPSLAALCARLAAEPA